MFDALALTRPAAHMEGLYVQIKPIREYFVTGVGEFSAPAK
jgi:hypothetical protein